MRCAVKIILLITPIASNNALQQEPMYLVLNTAVSHSWGFPEPCDKSTCGVCYHCYDCTNPGTIEI